MDKTNADRRRDAEREHRRQHILLAAERVFSRRPYDQASMQEIADEAGIGMKGVYQLFASKEELFNEIVALRLAEIDERMNATRDVVDPLERLRQLGVAYSAFFLERPQFFPVFATQKLTVDCELGSRFAEPSRHGIRKMEENLVKVMEDGVAAGVFVQVDPKLLAAIASGFFSFVTQYQLLVSRPTSAEACADELVRLLVNGIGAPR